MPAPVHSKAEQIVILVWPESPRSFLTALSDEDEVGVHLPRTTDPAMALVFSSDAQAKQALDEAVRLYPGHSFMIDKL